VSTAGSLPAAAGWAEPITSITSGQIAVTAAGTTVLGNVGKLLDVSFTINPAQLAATSVTLTLSGAMLNEACPR